MLISLNWIKDYVNLDGIEVDELVKQGRCRYCGGKFKGLFTKKCTDCKKYFRVNLEELSVEPLRENQPEEQKKGQEKTDSHAMERLMNDMPWWLRRLTAKYVDKYI